MLDPAKGHTTSQKEAGNHSFLISVQVSLTMPEEGHLLKGLLDGVLDSSELEQWLLQDMQELALDFCSLLGAQLLL